MDAGSCALGSARPPPASPRSRRSRGPCPHAGRRGASAGCVAQTRRGGGGGGAGEEGARAAAAPARLTLEGVAVASQIPPSLAACVPPYRSRRVRLLFAEPRAPEPKRRGGELAGLRGGRAAPGGAGARAAAGLGARGSDRRAGSGGPGALRGRGEAEGAGAGRSRSRSRGAWRRSGRALRAQSSGETVRRGSGPERSPGAEGGREELRPERPERRREPPQGRGGRAGPGHARRSLRPREAEMEAPAGEPPARGCGPPPAPVPERKKSHRAPSPARPKDVAGWSLAKGRRGPGPGAAAACSAASSARPDKKGRAVAPGARGAGTRVAGVRTGVRAKGRPRPGAGPRPPPPPPSLTDSSSEVSDCASEEARLLGLELALSSDAESAAGGPAGARPGQPPQPAPPAQQPPRPPASPDEPSVAASSVGSSRLPLSTSLAFSDLTEEMLDCGPGGFVRELEELRSENDYLKVGALRAERGAAGGAGCHNCTGLRPQPARCPTERAGRGGLNPWGPPLGRFRVPSHSSSRFIWETLSWGGTWVRRLAKGCYPGRGVLRKLPWRVPRCITWGGGGGWTSAFSCLEPPPQVRGQPFGGSSFWNGHCVHSCRGTCGPPLPRRGQNTILRLYPGLSPAQACPRLPFRAGPFESMTSGNIPLARVRLPPSLTVPQPGRMRSWENRFRGSFLNPRMLSSALSGTGPVPTAAPLAPHGQCPWPSHLPSERRGAALPKGAFPLGMWGPESFSESKLCRHPFSGCGHPLGAGSVCPLPGTWRP